MNQHSHVPPTTRQLLPVSSRLCLSFAKWGNLLKKHDAEREEAIKSAESARGWMADTLGSDSYPGLIRRARRSGMPGRQISDFLQSQAQGWILPSSSRSACQRHHPAPSHDFSHYRAWHMIKSVCLCIFIIPRSRLVNQVLWLPRYCLDAPPVISICLWWAMGHAETLRDPLRQDYGILMQLA